MSGDKKSPTPLEPSVREAAIALLADLDRFDHAAIGPIMLHKIDALRSALQTIETRHYEPWSVEAEAWVDLAYRQPAEPESQVALLYGRANMIAAYMAGRFAQSRTRPAPIDDIDLALEGIALIKRNAPPGELRPEHVLAVVGAAEHVLEQHSAFGLRWDADMRAIERWRAGDALPAEARDMLTAAAERFREYEAIHRAKFKVLDRRDPCDEEARRKAGENGAMAKRIEMLLETAQPGGRALIWPDHADLVVWLLELVHRRPDVPPLQEVEGVRDRLRKAIVASGGNKLAIDAKKMIDSLIEVALWADRRAYLAETGLAQARGEIAGGMNGRLHLVASSDREPETKGSSFDPAVHVPGLWRCAKCDFTLVQANLNAGDGSITARDEAGEKCPNDGSPMWRVTWRENAEHWRNAYESEFEARRPKDDAEPAGDMGQGSREQTFGRGQTIEQHSGCEAPMVDADNDKFAALANPGCPICDRKPAVVPCECGYTGEKG